MIKVWSSANQQCTYANLTCIQENVCKRKGVLVQNYLDELCDIQYIPWDMNTFRFTAFCWVYNVCYWIHEIKWPIFSWLLFCYWGNNQYDCFGARYISLKGIGKFTLYRTTTTTTTTKQQVWTVSTILGIYMMTSSNGSIFRVTGLLCGEFTNHRWIPHKKGQWRGALMFSLICVWINDWVNNREAGDLRRYRGHYDVTVMV